MWVYRRYYSVYTIFNKASRILSEQRRMLVGIYSTNPFTLDECARVRYTRCPPGFVCVFGKHIIVIIRGAFARVCECKQNAVEHRDTKCATLFSLARSAVVVAHNNNGGLLSVICAKQINYITYVTQVGKSTSYESALARGLITLPRARARARACTANTHGV